MIRATTVDKHLQDLQRVLDSIPKMEVTRRGLVMSALATGFALAVQPVSAETVTTDADTEIARYASLVLNGRYGAEFLRLGLVTD